MQKFKGEKTLPVEPELTKEEVVVPVKVVTAPKPVVVPKPVEEVRVIGVKKYRVVRDAVGTVELELIG